MCLQLKNIILDIVGVCLLDCLRESEDSASLILVRTTLRLRPRSGIRPLSHGCDPHTWDENEEVGSLFKTSNTQNVLRLSGRMRQKLFHLWRFQKINSKSQMREDGGILI